MVKAAEEMEQVELERVEGGMGKEVMAEGQMDVQEEEEEEEE